MHPCASPHKVLAVPNTSENAARTMQLLDPSPHKGDHAHISAKALSDQRDFALMGSAQDDTLSFHNFLLVGLAARH